MCKTIIRILNLINFYCYHYIIKFIQVKEKDDDNNDNNNYNNILSNLEKGIFIDR